MAIEIRKWLCIADLSEELTNSARKQMKRDFGYDTPSPSTVVGTVEATSVALAVVAFHLKVSASSKAGGHTELKEGEFIPSNTVIENLRVAKGDLVNRNKERGLK